MIEQKWFTEKVTNRLLERFPEFSDHCITKQGHIIDIEYKSPTETLGLYITTQDIEITIGFEDSQKISDWHVHITTFDEDDLDNDIENAVSIINDILTDKTLILYSKSRGYYICDIGEPEEAVVEKKWSDL